MANNESADTKPNPEKTSVRSIRWMLSALILLLVAGYTIALITGAIKDVNKIDLADLGLIALATLLVVALVNPGMLQRISIFQVGSIRLELSQIAQRQSDQQEALDGVRVVLGMLLPEPEQTHLVNLLNDKVPYQGGYPMRMELRHLRSLGLIRVRSSRTVEELRSNMHFDLSDYVRLTDLGQKSAQLIKDARETASRTGAEKNVPHQ